METNETIVQLTANNDTAHKVLDIIGHKITRVECDLGEDDVEVNYEFSHRGSSDSIGVCGANAIGCCVGAYNEKDGTLVGIFNYGDDGDRKVNIDECNLFVRMTAL